MVGFQEKIAWSKELSDFLAPSMRRDPLCSIETIKDEVFRGRSQVAAGFEDNNMVLAFAYRIEVEEKGRELVVVCGSSNGHGNLKKSIPFFQVLATKHSCDFIRIHTAFRAVARILKHSGFEPSEMVFRQRVNNGR